MEIEKKLNQLIELGEINAAKRILVNNQSLFPVESYLSKLAKLYVKSGAKNQAIELYLRLLQLDPVQPDYIYQLALLCIHQKPHQAIALLKKVRLLDSDNAQYEFILGEAYLHAGEFEAAWKHYEARRLIYHAPFFIEKLATKEFSLSNDQTILVFTEQGLGDSIQFARYLPLLIKKVKKVILCCEAALEKLFSRIEGVLVINKEELESGFIFYDHSIPIHSLPYYLSHFTPPPPLVIPTLPVQEKFNLDPQKLHIGFAWSGSQHVHGRNMPLNFWEELFEYTDLQFHSFQVSHEAFGLGNPKYYQHIIDHGPYLSDLTITADRLSKMDLFITIDSCLAHLAINVGIPTWLLLKHDACWRWKSQKSKPVWAPDIHLFRQKSPGHWNSVVESLKYAINLLLRKRGFSEIKKRPLTLELPTTIHELVHCSDRYPYRASMKQKFNRYINDEFIRAVVTDQLPHQPISLAGVTYILPFSCSEDKLYRLKNIKKVLNWLRKSFCDLEIIIAEQGEISFIDKQMLLPNEIHFFMHHTDSFNKGLIVNSAVKKAKHSICIIGDADIVLNATDVKKSIQIMRSNSFEILKPYCPFYNIIEQVNEHVPYKVGDDRTNEGNMMGGLFITNRESFLRIGGFPTEFTGWGYEDLALKIKVLRYKMSYQTLYFTAYHFDHPGTNAQHHTPACKKNRERVFDMLQENINFKNTQKEIGHASA